MNKRKISQARGTDPKTSEFAFFKKLKKDASEGFRSRPLQKESRQSSKRPESTNYSRGGNAGLYSISNTPKDSRDYSDKFKPQRIFSHEGLIFFIWIAWLQDQQLRGEVFARKRQKLRLCVADALFTDTENLCSKGHDIISVLLSRLFPMSTEENKYEDTHTGKEVNGTRYDLPDSRELDDQCKEQYQIPKRKLLELESSPYFSDHVLSPSFLRLDGKFNLQSKFPTYDSHNFPLELRNLSTNKVQIQVSVSQPRVMYFLNLCLTKQQMLPDMVCMILGS
ncbi:hypothetical protein ACSQ67_014765 [Phaseolus vulgaris]